MNTEESRRKHVLFSHRVLGTCVSRREHRWCCLIFCLCRSPECCRVQSHALQGVHVGPASLYLNM